MKNLFKLLFFCLFASVAEQSFAQGGLDGQIYDFEQRWLCDSNVNKTFYRLDVHRPGQAAVTIGNYNPDGTSYTPTGTIKSGPCVTPSGFPDSTFSFMATEACDYATGTGGTPYFILWRIGVHNTNYGTTRSWLGRFHAETGASYSPTGTYMAGFCSGWGEKTVTNMQLITATNTTGSVSATNGKFSVEIMNIGTVKATVTTNSTTYDLLPGTKFYCWAQEDPVSYELLGCPAINYDCTANGSTTLLITRKGD
jgi:hypothetical protein